MLLEQVERAEAALARSADEISGTLRVASFQTAVMVLLPRALTWLAARFRVDAAGCQSVLMQVRRR